jgi:hypothetical protein
LDRISNSSIANILKTITSDPPRNDKQKPAHIRKIAQLIQSLGAVNNFPARDRLEDALLIAAQRSNASGKKLMARLKLDNPANDQTAILVAAFATLGKIGTVKSVEFLTNFAKSRSPIAVDAQKALKLIESRQMKNSAAQATG